MIEFEMKDAIATFYALWLTILANMGLVVLTKYLWKALI